MPPNTNTKAMGWGKIYKRTQTILSEGPSNLSEWWIYELAKTMRKDADAISTIFSARTLREGFDISKDVFPACDEFFGDVCSLITMLPIKDGEQIERTLLIDVIVYAARECDIIWWYNMRERAALLFGVMHACMIQRRAEAKKIDDELGDLLTGIDLRNEDIAIMNELSGSLDALKLDLCVQDV